jgi:hypothetical protein
MGKALTNLVCSIAAVGALFVGGCKVNIQKNAQNNYNSSDSAVEKSGSKPRESETQKVTTAPTKLEDYFLLGDENPSTEPSSPEIIKSGGAGAYPFGFYPEILRAGVGRYIIPKIEKRIQKRENSL